MSKYNFGKASLDKLATCDPILQKLMKLAISDPRCPCDFTITCGYRGEKEQNEAYSKGLSKLKFPKGNHNKSPSRAVDAVPFVNGQPSWENPDLFLLLGKHITQIAKENSLPITWGGTWLSNPSDTLGWDAPHYELKP